MDAVDVGPFQEGLNVLHAPNATGKSTLFEALLRGLLAAHRGGGREAEAVRPWGRSLAPTVTVEFTHNGTDYRITKQFLDGPISKLERKEDGRFVSLAQGDAADEMVRQILSWNAAGRNLVKSQNWGLAQVLWAPQGDLALKDLSGDVVADIRASLGEQVSGPGASLLERRIEETYLQFYTPGGKLKVGRDAPAIIVLKDKVGAAKKRRAEALSQQQAFDEAARRVEDLRARRAQARYDADAVSKALAESRSRVESYKTLLLEKTQREERLKTAQAQYNELKGRIDAIKVARQELQQAAATLVRLEADMPLQEREVNNREREAVEAKAALEDARKGRQAVEEAQEIAERARRFLESHKTLENLKERAEKINKAQESLALCRRERTAMVAPDARALQAIRQAIKERDEAQVRIEAALITLEVVPEKDGSLVVLEGEETGTKTLGAGSPIRITGSPQVVADLPGVARLRAWGPTGSIEEHRNQRAAAERRLKELTEVFSTEDIEELERLAQKAEELDRKVMGASTQLDTLLSGDSVEEVERQRSTVAAVLGKILESHPEWKESPPDADALHAAAQEGRRSFIVAVESAEARWYAAESALSGAAAQRAGVAARLEEARAQVKAVEARLAGLTEDGIPDRERQEELKKAALSWEAAKASLEKVEKQVPAFGDDPVVASDKLQKQLEAAGEAATKALEEEKIEEGRLQSLSAQGPYSALAAAEEEVASLESEIVSEDLRVNAIRLVHDVLVQCRTEALVAVAGPVEEAATRMLRRIAGERLGSLEFGESFEPANVVPEIAASPVGLENVSGGEREQIYLATRLALAEVLAREERHLVVLDDVLAYTDAGRLARVMTILEEAAQRLQVLILTCHPERYRGLERAHFLDLEAILHDARAR